MTYAESVRFLYSLGNEVKAAKLGLDAMTVLLEALGRPDRGGAFIHVAGTNGKGSVSAMIESGLRAAGARTGLYTSPHLAEPTERIRLWGRPVERELFASAFERVHRAAERLIADGVYQAHPTYFETVTAMAFVIFKEQRVNAAVLEVGLGGRLDATNVITPKLAVITPVDFDHEVFLGKSLEAIAREKAGILKPGVPAVFAAQRPEVAALLAECAAAAGIQPVWDFCREARDLALYPGGSSFTIGGTRIDCPLAGEHQAANARTAIAALAALGVPLEIIAEGIRQTRWPGRLERVSAAPEIILDGAHNPAGARALAAHIQRFYQGRRVWIVYGSMRDKAVAEIGALLAPLAFEFIVTAPDQARSLRPEVAGRLIDHPRARIVARLAEALELARREADPDDAIFVTGSLFLVGEARELLVQ